MLAVGSKPDGPFTRVDTGVERWVAEAISAQGREPVVEVLLALSLP